MTKEIPMTNDEKATRRVVTIGAFGLRHSFVIRHSSFVIFPTGARK
jgi:hypothetical protein